MPTLPLCLLNLLHPRFRSFMHLVDPSTNFILLFPLRVHDETALGLLRVLRAGPLLE